MNEQMNKSKRDFLKKTAYVVPVILTLQAAPAIAKTGSPMRSKYNHGTDNGPGRKPQGNQKHRKMHHGNGNGYGARGKPQGKGGYS